MSTIGLNQRSMSMTDFDKKDFTTLITQITKSPEKAAAAHSLPNVDILELYETIT